MKTIPEFCYRITIALCVFASFGLEVRLLATSPAETKSEPKTHTLFMGADFDVQRNKEYYRARNVSRSSFVIKIDGREVLVPMDRGPVNLKAYAELKLTDASASILDLKSERAYTPGNDPFKKFASTVVAVNAEQNGMGWSTGKLNMANAELQNGLLPWQNPNAVFFRKDGDAYMNAVSQAESTFNKAAVQSAYVGYGAGYHAGELEDEKQRALFDAVEVTFRISSPKALTSPYVVFVAQYREHDEKPGSIHNWIYAQEIDALEANESRRERIKQGGFPLGFELVKFQLHLYNRGNELATNVSDKQVPLTRDEAFEYILLDYLGSHKSATVPATPGLGRLAPDVRSRLPAGTYRQTFFVKVNKDGVAEAAFVDEDCSQKVDDPFVETLIKDVRFKPALQKGRPIEGIAQLKFSELTI